ncbi:hypothetical protein D9615_008338 [Tricholomella constricta]|uniref:Uncharacterized protein n=1 Tax=Tricholomella constricta TaxID=117010 RepID=A0A8H5HDH3_9AGAR|nr:hypothetical protein D9615_008338 [Tricholomella constricta]
MHFHVRSASGSHSPSPQPSPPSSPSKAMSLSVGGVANIFLKMRQTQDRVKAHHIESSSGPPQTHSIISENASGKSGPFQLTETFICRDAVNMMTLLSVTRGTLLNYATTLGASTLADEQWKYIICGPKHRSNGTSTFRIQVSYTACTVRSTVPDPHKPVALDQIKNVPGCMTILQRNQD